MHQERTADPYNLHFESFSNWKEPLPTQQRLGWQTCQSNQQQANSTAKFEELQCGLASSDQTPARTGDLLDLVIRTDDSVMLSNCMNKCSFSSAPSFAMNSTSSTRELFVLQMSLEQSELGEELQKRQNTDCEGDELQDDCNMRERLQSFHRQNFSNHRPNRSPDRLCNSSAATDYKKVHLSVRAVPEPGSPTAAELVTIDESEER